MEDIEEVERYEDEREKEETEGKLTRDGFVVGKLMQGRVHGVRDRNGCTILCKKENRGGEGEGVSECRNGRRYGLHPRGRHGTGGGEAWPCGN